MTSNRGGRRWLILAAALVVQVAVSATVLGFPALVPFVRADLHLSVAQAGLFATVPAVGSFFVLTSVGWTVDRFGDRVVLVAGGVATGVVTALATLAGSFPVLVGLLALVGAGSATPTPAGSSAIIQEFAPTERGLVMSVRQTGIPVGGAVGALALPPLALVFGWRGAMVAVAAASIAGSAICLGLYALAGTGDVDEPRRANPARLVEGVRLRDTALAGACGAILAAGQFCLLSFLVLYLHETWRLPVVTGSLVLAATQVVGAAGRILWGWLSAALFGASRRATLVAVTAAAAVTSLLFGWLPASASIPAVAAVALLFGACALGWNGVYITLLAELARPGYQARGITVGMTVTQIGIVLGPALFGLLVDSTKSYRLVWALLGCALGLAAITFLYVREEPAGSKVAVLDAPLAGA